jgi:hypothetical protein
VLTPSLSTASSLPQARTHKSRGLFTWRPPFPVGWLQAHETAYYLLEALYRAQKAASTGVYCSELDLQGFSLALTSELRGACEGVRRAMELARGWRR